MADAGKSEPTKIAEKKILTLEEFLSAQTNVSRKFTIEAVSGKPDAVKITPWLPDAGCLCGSSIILPKNAIESIEPTGETHSCCGKMLLVAGIHFSKDHSISFTDLFEQLAASAASGHSSHSGHESARAEQVPYEAGAGPAGMEPFSYQEEYPGYARRTNPRLSCRSHADCGPNYCCCISYPSGKSCCRPYNRNCGYTCANSFPC